MSGELHVVPFYNVSDDGNIVSNYASEKCSFNMYIDAGLLLEINV